MLDGIELFHLSGERMRYLTQRQAVISRNIANADTPNYRGLDLAPFSVASPLLRNSTDGPGAAAGSAPPLAMNRTSGAHLGDQAGKAVIRMDRAADAYGEKPDRNTVSLEEQMVKSTDVGNAFELASTAYRRSVALMKLSLGSGSR